MGRVRIPERQTESRAETELDSRRVLAFHRGIARLAPALRPCRSCYRCNRKREESPRHGSVPRACLHTPSMASLGSKVHIGPWDLLRARILRRGVPRGGGRFAATSCPSWGAPRMAMRITDRTGHTSLAMLRRYERDVRRWRELGEAPVEADLAIPEIAAAFTAANAAALHQRQHQESRATARNHGQLGDKDSNLNKRSQNPLSCR
jgi:hypothetical protein